MLFTKDTIHSTVPPWGGGGGWEGAVEQAVAAVLFLLIFLFWGGGWGRGGGQIFYIFLNNTLSIQDITQHLQVQPLQAYIVYLQLNEAELATFY